MPKDRKGGKGGRKKGGHEMCPGYVDVNGIWNNGFYCPRWGSIHERYCCGDATRRFCCPKPKSTEPPPVVNYIPIVVGISVTLFVLAAVILLTCFFCPCCPGYKKRQKRLQKAEQQQSHDLPDIAVQASGQPLPGDNNPSPGPSPGPHTSYTPRTPTHTSSCTAGGEVLHCGCQWSPALARSPMTDLDSIMKQLYGDSANSWSELEPVPEYPGDKPPPYTEHDIHKIDLQNIECRTLGRRFKERKEKDAADSIKVTSAPPSRAISDPSQLCMKTFRPMQMRVGSPGGEMDAAKRDSGVLIEEGELAEGDAEGPETPFVLHGLSPRPKLARLGVLRQSRSSLEIDLTDIEATVHVPRDYYQEINS